MRARAGYWIGGGLVAAGVLGAVLWFVGSSTRLSDEVDGFQRVAIPGEATVQLDAHKHVLYYEASGAEEAVPGFTIEIADARTGAPLGGWGVRRPGHPFSGRAPPAGIGGRARTR